MRRCWLVTLGWLAACGGPAGGTDAGDGNGGDTDVEPCGNDTVDPGETCDDGGQVAGDGCTERCTIEGSYLRGATIITAVAGQDAAVSQVAITVHDGRIWSVEPELVDVPYGLEVVDLTGLTVLPGLIDSHTHLAARPSDVAASLQDYFAAGVTTLRDTGSRLDDILAWRADVASGAADGPRIVTSGVMFTAPGGHPVSTFPDLDPNLTCREVDDPAVARAAVRALAADGVDFIKAVVTDGGGTTARLDLAVLAAIVDEAHQESLEVTAHAGTPDDVLDSLAAGVDRIEHAFTREAPDVAALAALVDGGIAVTTTLAIFDFLQPGVAPLLGAYVEQMRDAGVTLVPGSDAAPGLAFGELYQRELALWVSDSGATPLQTIVAATRVAAEVMGLGAELGTVEVGKRADLLVVAGNPLTDIAALGDVRLLLKDGVVVVSEL